MVKNCQEVNFLAVRHTSCSNSYSTGALASTNIQKKLLAKNYTFSQVIEVALAEKAAIRNAKDMSKHEDKPVHHVNREVKGKQPYSSGRGTKKKCDRCGMSNHTREQCRYKNATCYRCHLTGHLQSECRSKPVGRGQGHAQRQSGRFPQS